MVRQWQTLIEAHIDPETDGYLLRLFSIAFTMCQPNQIKRTTYAKSSQVREMRQEMFEIITRETSACDLKDLVSKFVSEVIGREIEKACQGIYLLQNVYVHKDKILKSPQYDQKIV
ncbi:hypothetical protein H4Q26_017562 [Puccinia striiformis f. sp. tritici PST-130]|nr:hypothetical protein H4Q26_017562 [Puccinia striiformis f. sp. tritici PST-130]